MKRMLFQTVMHSQQRYDTVGDYQEAHGFISFTISDMCNWKYEALVAVHELVEKILVNARGIKDADIDKFDMDFERDRDLGDENEPGDALAAPYHYEHVFATKVERMLADQLGIDWDAYDRTVLGLSK
jgi:hypothetical protein